MPGREARGRTEERRGPRRPLPSSGSLPHTDMEVGRGRSWVRSIAEDGLPWLMWGAGGHGALSGPGPPSSLPSLTRARSPVAVLLEIPEQHSTTLQHKDVCPDIQETSPQTAFHTAEIGTQQEPRALHSSRCHHNARRGRSHSPAEKSKRPTKRAISSISPQSTHAL